jgi:hypothetical protein
LIRQIKSAAALGASELKVPEYQVNQYDRDLLIKDGFSVSLWDKKNDPMDYKADFIGRKQKEWTISW